MSTYGIKAAHALHAPGKWVSECLSQTNHLAIDVGGISGSALDARLFELTQRRFRKMGRFMQLALTCAVEATTRSGLKLPSERTGVFLATGLGNISDLIPFSHAVFGDPGYHLSAIQFANSVGNAGAFYIAQALSLTGPVLAVSQDEISFEAALMQALTLIDDGTLDYALVGAVDVVMPKVTDHLARMGLPPDAPYKLSEGSAFWLLGRPEANDHGTLLSLEFKDSPGPAGVFASQEFDTGMHYARSGLWPTLFLEKAQVGETFETLARTREGLATVTQVRRGALQS